MKRWLLNFAQLAGAAVLVAGAMLAVLIGYFYLQAKLQKTLYGDFVVAIAALAALLAIIVGFVAIVFLLKEAVLPRKWGPIEQLEWQLEKGKKQHETFVDLMKTWIGWALLVLIAIGVFYALSLRHQTIHVGESVDMHLEGLAAIVSAQASPAFQWSDADTDAVVVRVERAEGIEVGLKSLLIKTSQIGKQNKMIGIESTLRVTILPSATPGSVVLRVWFDHPKLKPPVLNEAPVDYLRLTVQRP